MILRRAVRGSEYQLLLTPSQAWLLGKAGPALHISQLMRHDNLHGPRHHSVTACGLAHVA